MSGLEIIDDEIEEPTCDFDSFCPHYPGNIKTIHQLKSQLEREQKCVEIAIDSIELALTYFTEDKKHSNCDFESGFHTPECYVTNDFEEALTEIKSLREEGK